MKPIHPVLLNPAPPRFRFGDLAHLFKFALFTPLAWLLPARAWPPVCRLMACFVPLPRPGMAADLALAGIDRTARRVAVDHHTHRLLELCWLLRQHVPWRGDIPVSLRGAAHIHHALAGGNGAVLWVFPLAYGDLMVKAGLHRAGFAVHHLSAQGHGYSDSRWGGPLLNPVKTRVEVRFLAERLVLGRGSNIRPLRTLKQRLNQNRVVSITAVHSGRRVAEVEFLGGRLRLACGAPHLALASGAPLLPVYAVPTPDGCFQVEFGPPLTKAGDAPGRAAEIILARAYAQRMEVVVRRHPGLWRGFVAARSRRSRFGKEPGKVAGQG